MRLTTEETQMPTGCQFFWLTLYVCIVNVFRCMFSVTGARLRPRMRRPRMLSSGVWVSAKPTSSHHTVSMSAPTTKPTRPHSYIPYNFAYDWQRFNTAYYRYQPYRTNFNVPYPVRYHPARMNSAYRRYPSLMAQDSTRSANQS